EQLALLQWLAQRLCRLAGDKAVTGAVKAIAPDPLVGIKLIGQGVKIGVRRQGLMERGVEHRDLGQGRKQAAGGQNPLQVSGVMQRGQLAANLDLSQNLVIDQGRRLKSLATV